MCTELLSVPLQTAKFDSQGRTEVSAPFGALLVCLEIGLGGPEEGMM